MVFRYRARNFPETLVPEDNERWQQHRFARLIEGAGGVRNVDTMLEELDKLQETADARAEPILEALHEYMEAIVPDGG